VILALKIDCRCVWYTIVHRKHSFQQFCYTCVTLYMPTHSSLSLILYETSTVELLLLDGPTFQEFQIVNKLFIPN